MDVVLDMVGGPYIPRNIALLRRDGRLVFIAFLQGSRCELDFMPVMLKRLRVTGFDHAAAQRGRRKRAIRDALAREIWPAFASRAIADSPVRDLPASSRPPRPIG